MKRLLISLAFFLITVIVLLLILFFLPFNKRYGYCFIKNDSDNRSVWLYDRIHLNPTPIDIAFVGSSHTIHAINDSAIELEAERLQLPKVNIVNLGYYRFGRNMDYETIDELLKTHHLKALVLEIRGDEDISGNIDFAYVADEKDVFKPVFPNRNYFTDVWKAIKVRLGYIKTRLGFNYSNFYPAQQERFGYGTSDKQVDSTTLNFTAPDTSKDENPFIHFCTMNYPLYYLKRISTLCIRHNVKLYFIYLPEFIRHLTEPKELLTYKKYGTLLFPPKTIFSSAANFMDDAHLNNTGASKITDYLLKQQELFH